MNNEKRYREALEFVHYQCVKNQHIVTAIDNIRYTTEQALNTTPPQEMEQYIETRWCAYNPTTGWIDCEHYRTKEMAEVTGHQAVRVDFICQRPAKPKVKRREEIKIWICNGLHIEAKSGEKIKATAKLYAEWEEEE